MIKHLIFDFDGVIVDSEILAARAFTKILSDININYTEDFFANKYAGNKMATVVDNLSQIHNIGDKKKFFNKLMKQVSNIFHKEIKPVPNIKHLLLTNKLNRFIASNSGKKRIIKGLELVSLDSFFENNKIYSVEKVRQPKPSPEIYLKIINENNLNLNEVIVLEDSVAGVRAARLANLTVIGITSASHWKNKSPKELIESGSIAILDSYLNFNDLLDRIKVV